MKLIYKNLDQFTLPPKLNISDYLKAIDSSGSGFVIIQENNRVTNIVTDGDMRRAIIAGKSVDDKYETLKKDCTTALVSSQYSELKSLIERNKSKDLPLVDKDQSLIAILTNAEIREDFKGFIMAGGEGKRLRPLTLKTPKPLLTIAGKSLIDRAVPLQRRRELPASKFR